MDTKNNFIFKPVKISHPDLSKIISLSIGIPTEQKIHSVLTSYNTVNNHLIGAFFNDILIGIIGIEISNKNGIIKHIAVSKENQMQGIGKQLIIHVANYFLLKHLTAETDDDSLKFYKKCGFQCRPCEGQHGQRYHCVLAVNKQA